MIRAAARRTPWAVGIVVGLAALLTMTSDPIGVFNDDAIYLLTARALAEGQGLVYPHLPGTPPAIHYPPLWPAVLAVAWKLAPPFPASVAWFKLLNPLILGVAAALLTRHAVRELGAPTPLAAAAVLAGTVAVPTLLLTNHLLSEPLFLALAAVALGAVERLRREGGARALGLAALACAAVALCRTIGGAVVVAGVLLLLSARRWRDALLLATGVGALLAPWQLHVWRSARQLPPELLGSYGPYLSWATQGYQEGGAAFAGAVLAKNLAALWDLLGSYLVLVIEGPARHGLLALVLLMGVVGSVALWRADRARVLVLTLIVYAAAALAWPFQVDRFVWGVWPLLVLLGAVGGHAVWTALRTQERRGVAPAWLAACVLFVLSHQAFTAIGLARRWDAQHSASVAALAIPMARAVNGRPALHGRPLAADLSPLVALYTGERVVPTEIFRPWQHVRPKTPEDRVAELVAIDARFRPDAWVVLGTGVTYSTLRRAALEGNRPLAEISDSTALVRVLLADPR